MTLSDNRGNWPGGVACAYTRAGLTGAMANARELPAGACAAVATVVLVAAVAGTSTLWGLT